MANEMASLDPLQTQGDNGTTSLCPPSLISVPHTLEDYAFPSRIDHSDQGHTKIESTVRYLGVDIEDALALAEGTEI
jgi:hypothetical protein